MNTTTETLSVVVEREISHPPEKIWRALTQPHLIEEWLMKNDFQPKVDHRFNLRGDWGAVDCRVMVVEPNKTAVIEDKMLASVTVHFDIAASLGGVPHVAGDTIQVRRERTLIEANGQKKYWTPSATCWIRDKPELDCYETGH